MDSQEQHLARLEESVNHLQRRARRSEALLWLILGAAIFLFAAVFSAGLAIFLLIASLVIVTTVTLAGSSRAGHADSPPPIRDSGRPSV